MEHKAKKDGKGGADGQTEPSRATGDMGKPIVRSNGRRGNRTPASWARAEQAFAMHVDGATVRAIAAALGCGRSAVASGIRDEAKRREKEFASYRERALMEATTALLQVCADAKHRFEILNDILLNGGRVSGDSSLSDIIRAREQICRLYGILQPTRSDDALERLVQAIRPRDGVVDVIEEGESTTSITVSRTTSAQPVSVTPPTYESVSSTESGPKSQSDDPVRVGDPLAGLKHRRQLGQPRDVEE